MRGIAALCAAICVPLAAALADPPASIDPGSAPSAVEASFEAFAREWMTRARARGERERANPRLTPGARELVATYREVAPEFETELQATGRSGTAYVGVLRYSEHVMACSDLRASVCRVASTVPVTEVFRFREGRWVY